MFNGPLKRDDRNDKAKQIWEEIADYATKPDFDKNLKGLIARRKAENSAIYSFGEFGPENPLKPRRREESLSELEAFLQGQVKPNIKDLKVVETVVSQPEQPQGQSAQSAAQIWVKNDPAFSNFRLDQKQFIAQPQGGEKKLISVKTQSVPLNYLNN